MNSSTAQDRVLVIIVTYNGTKWINRCLDSVRESSLPLSAFIVDNKSTDDTVSIIKSQYPEFMLLESTENLGFGGANNIGLKYAFENNFDYVYLLNQDAWVMPDTISTMVAAHKNNPEYGILSPLQTNLEKSKLDQNFLHIFRGNNEILSDYACNTMKEVYSVRFVMAAHWLIPRACLYDVGLFSPIFYHYGEDDNYIARAQYFNYKVGIVPSVIGVHDREFRETSKEKDIFMQMLFYWRDLANINKPFGRVIIKSIMKSQYKLLKLVKKYRDISIYFSYIPKLFIIGDVRKDRANSKIKGYYFKK